MVVKARLSYLRISPRKTRLLADAIRGKKVEDALNILNFVVKKGAEPVKKLLKSAIANAENNFKLKKENLFISKIIVNEGPSFKRFMPRAMGRAFQIQKRSSHILIELDEIHKNGRKNIAADDKQKKGNDDKDSKEETSVGSTNKNKTKTKE